MIHASTFPTFEPVRALVDADVLAAAERHARRTALVDSATGRTLTFAQLADGARRLAGGLADRGVRRGDAVALVAANAPDYAVAVYGAQVAGAAVAGINPLLTEAEIARQLALTEPKLVIRDVPDLLAAPAAGPGDRDPADVAFLFASSGTSGLPKLAVHTHAGASAFLQAFAAMPSMRLSAADVIAPVVPFTHLYGSAVVTHALRAGARVVTTPIAGFGLDAYVRRLADHRVTVAYVTPPVLRGLAAAERRLPALRLVVTSAAPCPPEWAARAQERLGCPVADCLGSTEAWGFAATPVPSVPGSVGRLAPNLEARIVARELWIRGPQVMAGYRDGTGIDAGGWLHTGDACRLDADGNLFIVDRLKDLIKVGGYSVAPAEVERELTRHPAVADAAVVGRPHPDLGEVPVAFVALRAPVAPDELRAWLAGGLAPWKHPREVIVIDQVPRTPAGKLLRRELAQPVATNRPSSARRETPTLP